MFLLIYYFLSWFICLFLLCWTIQFSVLQRTLHIPTRQIYFKYFPSLTSCILTTCTPSVPLLSTCVGHSPQKVVPQFWMRIRWNEDRFPDIKVLSCPSSAHRNKLGLTSCCSESCPWFDFMCLCKEERHLSDGPHLNRQSRCVLPHLSQAVSRNVF